jgi:hypothetical protein
MNQEIISIMHDHEKAITYHYEFICLLFCVNEYVSVLSPESPRKPTHFDIPT